ncbi:DUF523 domain-containing protein [Oryzibacter oryziterrae]|uniref:DUF523 domain-containing protein n=1 Tax=Oryzibacter oryziterrae TaxID=2766474 RepID=UPI001F222577|nr:DUF523 domain-containing protein [Oryzibacter oryziterrae]
MTIRILVSACLLGQPVRYDGNARLTGHAILARWQAEGRVVAACPEGLGGLLTPRPSAEIERAQSGDDVLDGRARVFDALGDDVTTAFIAGARATLDLALATGCTHALLTERSPSCGSATIYDGSFSGLRHPGNGVTTALLARHGITVFGDDRIEELDALLLAQS